MEKNFDELSYYAHRLRLKEASKTGKSKIQYYINKEKRTIAARMVDCQYDIIDILYKMGIDRVFRANYRIEDFLIKDTYRGVAKCAPEDTWDEEVGKRIARNRLLKKYHKDKTRCLFELEAIYTEILEEIGSRAEYSGERYKKALCGEL